MKLKLVLTKFTSKLFHINSWLVFDSDGWCMWIDEIVGQKGTKSPAETAMIRKEPVDKLLTHTPCENRLDVVGQSFVGYDVRVF